MADSVQPAGEKPGEEKPGEEKPLLDADASREPWGVDHLARWVLNVYFRRVEVHGVEAIPRQGAVVFVGNHVNGLIDPAILMAYLPRKSRFLGKSTLWNEISLRLFLRWAAAIPVYRREDPGVDPSRNASTFARCHQALAAGGTIALFPEGRSHNEASIVPLKTGMARIVLDALRDYPGTDIAIVPVGLTFEDKTRFRSRLLVKVGTPIDPGVPVDEADQEAAWEQVRELTDRTYRGLEAVTLNYPSWDEARLIEQAAEIYDRQAGGTVTEQELADAFDRRRAFIDGYEELLAQCPEQVGAVADEVRIYDQELALFGLEDEEVAARYSRSYVWRSTLKALTVIAVRSPLGVIGTVMNVLPYRAVAWISRRLADSPDVVSTYKIFPSLVLFPLTWVAWATAAGWAWGWTGGLAALFLAPISGYFAVRFHQRLDLFIGRAKAFFTLRKPGTAIAHLADRRRLVLRQVAELVQAWQRRRKIPAAGPTETT